MAITEQLEDEWLLDSGEPNASGDTPAGAIVDFAAENVLVKTPGHSG
jgi:hypothetical protein